MNKKILILLGIAWFSSGFSQKTLNSYEGPHTVAHPEGVRLLPGFHANSGDGNYGANTFFRAIVGSAEIGDGENNSTNPPVVHIPSNGENYVYTRNYLIPVTSGSDYAPQVQSISYYNGLGRLKQTIAIKASPAGKDLVTPIEYDDFGRQTTDFLPVPMSTTNGTIQSLSGLGVDSYYSGIGLGNYAYSEKILETSPLDRILEQYGAGSEWRANNKKISFSYLANESNEVLKFNSSTSWSNEATSDNLTIDANRFYPQAALYKNKVTDEDGNVSYEFKNGEGQTLLVRKMLGDIQVDTYYVYNKYNQLAFVISPKATEAIKTGFAITTDVLNELCYQYHYDGKNRLVEKKLPGKGWEYMVYNKADQLVLTQDANLREATKNNFAKGGWLFTKYDKFGRVVYTGFFENYSTRLAMQQALNNMSALNIEDRVTTASITLQGMPLYYTKKSFPNGGLTLLSVNYYDTLPPYSDNPPLSNNYTQSILTETPTQQGNSIVSTKSLPLVSLVKNIDDDDWTKNYTWYDTKGRPIETYSKNHLGGFTRVESKINFSGVADAVKTTHSRASTDVEQTINERFVYDNQNRLVDHYHQVNSNTEVLLTKNRYDELGQLENKKVGDNLQSIHYKYNIRGWMTQINDVNSLGADLFGYKIDYNTLDSRFSGTPKFNGNIAQVTWRSKYANSDNQTRNYSYSYDNLNRLLDAKYRSTNGDIDYYNENLSYDVNGNITSLNRFSAPSIANTTTAEQIDQLSYLYKPNSNLLLTINDAKNNPLGYVGGGNTIEYDANGNMTKHLDKNISLIEYNYLNLPTNVSSESKTSFSDYIYRADGVKVKKIARIEAIANGFTTFYLDGFQYFDQGGRGSSIRLQFVPTAEGYFDFEKNKYIYNYLDHLGNVRLSYFRNDNNSAEVLEESNYYPFGLKHEGYNWLEGNSAYNYKYNGKELQETGMYDYGARMYMPDIGRWGVIDPLAETSRRYSPFVYAYNNSIRFIDPDGRQSFGWGKGEDGVWEWHEDLTRENYKTYHNRGYTDYREDGSVLNNVAIIGDEASNTGKTYLGNGEAFYLPAGSDSNGSTGLVELSSWVNDMISKMSNDLTSQFSGGWHSEFARKFVKDTYSIGLSSEVSAYLGVGSTPINFTLITRGDPSLVFAPTVYRGISTGIEGSAGITFSSGMYTGDSRQIRSSFLEGPSVGASVGLGIGGNASLGVDYAPASQSDPFGKQGGFINTSIQVGIGIQGSPATGLNYQFNYQKTNIVKPIFQFK